jgi:hypothetical protein
MKLIEIQEVLRERNAPKDIFSEKTICAIRGVVMAIVPRAVCVVMTGAMLIVHRDMFLAKIVYVTPNAMVVIALRVFVVMVYVYLALQDMYWVKIACAIKDVVTGIVPRVVYVAKVDAMFLVLPVVTLLLIVCVIVHESNINSLFQDLGMDFQNKIYTQYAIVEKLLGEADQLVYMIDKENNRMMD